MFNSKKKKAAAEAQRAQIAALEAQLEEVRAERAALDERLSALGNANEQLDRQLAALDQGVRSMGEELVTLSSSTAGTNRLVRAIEERLGEVEVLQSELDGINDRLQSFADAPTATEVPPPPPPAVPPPPPPPGADTDLDGRLDELRERLDELARQTTSIDARVTSVSIELANQLTELGNDIDELAQRGGQPDLEARLTERLDAAIDDVLDSTERLAAEQARYEIQFRSDLAELAERLRRPSAH